MTLGFPRKMNNPGFGDWECPYRISGFEIQRAFGVDALQALSAALEGIRTTLLESGKKYSWSKAEKGFTGFNRIVPDYFVTEFKKKPDRLIEKELKTFLI